MSLPDRSIDSKILDYAKDEFLEKGFAEASLRSICSKPRVTTGTFAVLCGRFGVFRLLSKEKALQYCDTITKLFNWQAVFVFLCQILA